jgi:hypothetical protein
MRDQFQPPKGLDKSQKLFKHARMEFAGALGEEAAMEQQGSGSGGGRAAPVHGAAHNNAAST